MIYNAIFLLIIILIYMVIWKYNKDIYKKFRPFHLILSTFFVNIFPVYIFLVLYKILINIQDDNLIQCNTPDSTILGYIFLLIILPTICFIMFNLLLFFSYILQKNLFILIIHLIIFSISIIYLFLNLIQPSSVFNYINLFCCYTWMYISLTFIYKFGRCYIK